MQLGEGAGRHPGCIRRTTTRPSSTPPTSGRARTRPPTPALVDVLTTEAPGDDRLARGPRRGVHPRERRATGSLAAAGRVASVSSRSETGPATRSRRRCARRSRPRAAPALPNLPLESLERTESGWRGDLPAQGRRADRDRRGRGRPGRGRPLLPRGEGARRAVDESPRRDRRGRPGSPLELGAEARDLDALQYHPNGGAWPATMQGYSIPETTRGLRRRASERRGRGLHRLARPARRGLRRHRRRGGSRAAAPRRRTAGRPSGSTRPAFRRRDADISLPYMLRRYRAAGVDPLAEPIFTYPGAPLPERRARHRRARRDDARGSLRLRRDRGRDARAQQDDGQLACSSAASSDGAPDAQPRRRRAREGRSPDRRGRNR